MAKQKVFLSSPKYGMTPYRTSIAEMMAKSDVFELIAMENFGARSEPSPDYYRRLVEQCDIFVGLVGPRFGGSPKGELRSHSEIEYDLAQELHKPQLMLMVQGEDEPGAPKETPEQSLRQLAFRSRVLSEKQADLPHTPQLAATSVLNALAGC